MKHTPSDAVSINFHAGEMQEVIFSPATRTRVAEQHTKIGRGHSSLLRMTALFESFCKGLRPGCGYDVQANHERVKEHYTFDLGDYTLQVNITSYSASTAMPAVNIRPDTVKAVNDIARSMEVNIPNSYKHKLQALMLAVFRHNSDTCVFRTECEDDEWVIEFRDTTHRTEAHVSVQYTELFKTTNQHSKSFIEAEFGESVAA